VFWNENEFGSIKAMRISRQPSLVRNVEYFSYLGSMLTNDTKRTRGIKTRICVAKASFASKLDLNLRL
jgi:hypothetical protein